jgi:hypothetical protein
MISKEALEEFKKIYKKEFGEDISDKDALDEATNLLNLYKAVYLPLTKIDYDKLQKRREETK